MRMARIYLWIGKYYEAKDVLIKACRLTPSTSTWLGLAIACYRQKEVDQAEQALCEANILDPHNPEVWGMLCVVCLEAQPPKMQEAEMAMKQALKFGLNTSETWPVGYGKFIVEQIASLYAKEGRYAPAASMLIRGLESSYAPSLNKQLGEVYFRNNELSLAATAFAEVVGENANASPAEEQAVLVQLVQVCRQLKRSRETRQYEDRLKRIGLNPEGKPL
jgi:predicted Zn-dependent protease